MGPLNRHLLLYVLLFLSAVFTVNAAVHTAENVRRLRERSDEPIQPWMNVTYIARAYDVPPGVVAEAIGSDRWQHDGRPIGTIASDQGVAARELIERITVAIDHFRATLPAPPTPPRPSN